MGESTKYLLIGGGIASVTAAQAIRKRDTEGRVMLITADRHMPYDRPPLSKNFLGDDAVTADDAASKFDNFYPDNNIELLRSTVVKNVNRRAHTVTLQDGSEVHYERLLLATGSSPRKLDMSLVDSPELFVLRTVDDASAIRARIHTAKSVLVLGSGFLGPEVAAQCKTRGLEVTIISPDAYPWQSFASPRLGRFIADYFISKGIKLNMGNSLGGLDKLEEGIKAVTESGFNLMVDFVIAAIGASLNMDLAMSAGIEYVRETGVDVDEYLQSSDPDIYAAGDIAFFKDIAMNRKWHLEHHLNARWQGEVAGANLAGERLAYDKVPYFFSDFFDLHMVLRGHTSPELLTSAFGSLEEADFIEVYHNEAGIVSGGIAISREEKKLDPISDKLEEIIRTQQKVDSLTPSAFVAAE